MKCPHPFPWQGSKRHIAARILQFFPEFSTRLYQAAYIHEQIGI